MSVEGVNRGGIAAGIARLFQIKGKNELLYDNVAIPNLSLLDSVQASPFQNFAIPAFGVRDCPAVVGETGYVWVSPGVNVILEVRAFTIWLAAASVSTFVVRTITQADQTTIGVTGFSRLTRGMLSDEGITFPENGPSVIDNGTHNATVGTGIRAVRGNGNELTLRVPFSPSFFLVGVNRSSVLTIPGLAVHNLTANEQFQCSVEAVEWLVP